MSSQSELSKLHWLMSMYRHVYQWFITHGEGDTATVLAKMRALEARSFEYQQRAIQLAASADE